MRQRSESDRTSGWSNSPNFLIERHAFRHALFAFGGQWRNAAVGWVDDDGATRDAIDADDLVARVEPKAVVAANGATGRLGNLLDEGLFARRRLAAVASLRRGRSVGVAGPVAKLLHQLGTVFKRSSLLVGQRGCRFPIRSRGVWVSLLQLPWRSGLPSAVRGATQLLPLAGEKPSSRTSAPASEGPLCRREVALAIADALPVAIFAVHGRPKVGWWGPSRLQYSSRSNRTFPRNKQ